MKRIIPCLDVADGHVVKGINFLQIRDVGDPIALAKFYNDEGADELVFLDITATIENRQTTVDLVRQIAKNIFIPFTIGGGIRSVKDMKLLLRAGADKITINSAAVKNPQLIADGAMQFGNQCIVVAIDAKRNGKSWEVYTSGGRNSTGLDVVQWAKKVERLGAGELMLTSMDKDGTKTGYDLELYRAVSRVVNIPIIASGGGGSLNSIVELFLTTNVDAALAASIFHYGEYSVRDVKNYLHSNQIEVRL